MNIPAIRAALQRLDKAHALRHDDARSIKFMEATIRVGLRACDEYEQCPDHETYVEVAVIADILREAGVEVER